MKKLALLSILLLGSLAMAFAENQGITVGSPYLVTQWCIGKNLDIIWSFWGSGPNMKQDPGNQQVRIVLVQAGVRARPRVIVESTPNNGQFHWVIASDVVPGEYHVRVVTLNKLFKGESEVFTIKSCPMFETKGPRMINKSAEFAMISFGLIAGRVSGSTQGNLLSGRKVRVLLKKGGVPVISTEYTLNAQGIADYQFTHLQLGTYEVAVEKVATPPPPDPASMLNVCFKGTTPAQRTVVIASGSTDITGQDFAILYDIAFNMNGVCW
jgi:hypothetical protein